MKRHVDVPTPADVFFDPIVQLAALCPICALAALRPEAAIAALAPALVLFNPALNPEAALLSFALAPVRPRREWMQARALHAAARPGATGIAADAAWGGSARAGGGIVVRPEGAVARSGGDRWVFTTLKRA